MTGSAAKNNNLWCLAAPLATTPKERRERFLTQITHAAFAPGAVETMHLSQIKHVFGSHTVGRYVRDMKQRKQGSYRGNFASLLPLLAKTEVVWRKLLRNANSLEASALVKGTERVEDIVKLVDAVRDAERSFGGGNIQAARAAIATTKTLCTRIVRGTIPPNSRQNKSLKGNVDSIQRLTDSLRLKEFIAFKNVDEALFATIFSTTREQAASNDIAVMRDGSEVLGQRLKCVQELSVSGVFTEDALLAYLVSKGNGTRTIHREIVGLLEQQDAGLKKPHTSTYAEFKKMFPNFVEETLGATLFAFPNKKPIGQWDVKDAEALSAFVVSRYVLLCGVMEGIADPNQNPLGDNIDPAQMQPLVYEIFRSALYPNYCLQIRTGYGGTDQNGTLVRAASYIMNALDIMSIFNRVNKRVEASPKINVPTLHVVSADQLSANENNLDQNLVLSNGQNLLCFLKDFIEEYYPDHCDRVVFSQPSRQQIYHKELYALAIEAANQVVSRPEKLGLYEIEALQALLNFAAKHAHVDTPEERKVKTLNYVAGHLMPEVFATINASDVGGEPIWKIGSRSENFFNVFQCTIRNSLFHSQDADGIVSFPNAIGENLSGLFTTTTVGGRPPPYYHDEQSSSDIAVEEIARSASASSFDTALISGIRQERTGAASDLRAMLSHPRIGRGDVSVGLGSIRQFIQCRR